MLGSLPVYGAAFFIACVVLHAGKSENKTHGGR